jgi:hypothetical protein
MTLTLCVPHHTDAIASLKSTRPSWRCSHRQLTRVATELRVTGKTWLGRRATHPSNNQYTRQLRIQLCSPFSSSRASRVRTRSEPWEWTGMYYWSAWRKLGYCKHSNLWYRRHCIARYLWTTAVSSASQEMISRTKYSMPSATSARERDHEQETKNWLIQDSEKSSTFGQWPKFSMESQYTENKHLTTS